MRFPSRCRGRALMVVVLAPGFDFYSEKQYPSTYHPFLIALSKKTINTPIMAGALSQSYPPVLTARWQSASDRKDLGAQPPIPVRVDLPLEHG